MFEVVSPNREREQTIEEVIPAGTSATESQRYHERVRSLPASPLNWCSKLESDIYCFSHPILYCTTSTEQLRKKNNRPIIHERYTMYGIGNIVAVLGANLRKADPRGKTYCDNKFASGRNASLPRPTEDQNSSLSSPPSRNPFNSVLRASRRYKLA